VSRRTLSLAAAVVATLVLTAVALTTYGRAEPQPAYRITVHASATTVESGQAVTITGRVRPVTTAARKQNVKLQVADPNGPFETMALDRPNRKGKYAFTQTFRVPGTYLVRTRIAAGRGHSEGISEELKITVVPLSVP
jgi:uncharacterized protein (DUF58 family)